MKKKIVASLSLALAAVIAANAQDVRTRRTRPDAHSKPSGGIVEKPYSGNYIKIVNAQKTVANDVIKTFVLKMRMETLLPFEACTGEHVDVDVAKSIAEQLVKETRVGAGILIIDDPTRDAHIQKHSEASRLTHQEKVSVLDLSLVPRELRTALIQKPPVRHIQHPMLLLPLSKASSHNGFQVFSWQGNRSSKVIC